VGQSKGVGVKGLGPLGVRVNCMTWPRVKPTLVEGELRARGHANLGMGLGSSVGCASAGPSSVRADGSLLVICVLRRWDL
jgi:hypothetical protein